MSHPRNTEPQANGALARALRRRNPNWNDKTVHAERTNVIQLGVPGTGAGSLVQGTVRASELIRALQRGGRPSSLARSISEMGRIAKTLHLLAYIDDEAYRRRILRQINRGEGRHSVARAVFFGKRGELRRRYKEGQEDQLGALGLVVNAIVLWNTRYMDAVLRQLQADGDAIADADVRRLSPLVHKHLKLPRSVPLLPSRGRQRRGTVRATGPERWT